MADVKVVLVTGSRHWYNRDAVFNALIEHLGNSMLGIVRHGGCPTGADQWADEWASLQPGIGVDRIPAAWDIMGKRAGPARNTQMVGLGADLCLAFPELDSRGTVDCMRKAHRSGIEVVNYGFEVDYK